MVARPASETEDMDAVEAVRRGDQIAAAHQYLAIGAHYAGETAPQLAAFFYQQADEERGHAMKMVDYLSAEGPRSASARSRRRAASSPTTSPGARTRSSRRSA